MFSFCEGWFLRALFVPLLTVIPPVLIAMTTENMETLVSFLNLDISFFNHYIHFILCQLL